MNMLISHDICIIFLMYDKKNEVPVLCDFRNNNATSEMSCHHFFDRYLREVLGLPQEQRSQAEGASRFLVSTQIPRK